MSILDPQETVCNRAEIACLWDNPLHPNISDSKYESLRTVYYPIRDLYQWFFLEFCCDEDLNLVNANVVAELARCGVFTSPAGGALFTTKEDLVSVRRYVITRLYPASYEDMKQFISRVSHGDLQFLCRYPDREGVTPMDRIKANKSQYGFNVSR